MTALREPRLAPRRDLDRERDQRRGSRGRGRGRGERSRRRCATARRYRLRLVAHDPARLRLATTTSSRTRRSGSSSTTSGTSRTRRTSTGGSHHAWERGLRRRSTALRRRGARRARARSRTRPSSSTTTTSTSRRGSCASERPDAPLAHFIHIPWAQSDYWRVLPERDPRARSTTACSRTTSSASTPTAGGGTSCARARTSPAPSATAATVVRLRRRPTLVTSHPISVDPAEFDELAASDGRARGASAQLVERRPRAADPARRPHRPVEERRARLPRLRAASSRRTRSSHGRVRMLALLDPSRQDIPEYAEYLGAIQRAARGVNDRFRQRRLEADRPARSRTTSTRRSPRTSSSTSCS